MKHSWKGVTKAEKHLAIEVAETKTSASALTAVLSTTASTRNPKSTEATASSVIKNSHREKGLYLGGKLKK